MAEKRKAGYVSLLTLSTTGLLFVGSMLSPQIPVALAATSGSSVVDPNAEQPLFQVTGQVVSDTGLPVANAMVWLGNAAWGFTSTETDAKGNYRFMKVPQGQYSVMATANAATKSSTDAGSGSALTQAVGSVATGQISVQIGTHGSGVGNVTLNEIGGSLSGQIHNATTNTDLAGLVQIEDSTNHVIWESFTNQRGAFQVQLPVGVYTIKTFVGNASHEDMATVRPNVASFVMLDVPMTAIMGNVSNSSGRVVLNAEVTVKDKYGNTVGRALTDIYGQYLVNGLIPGDYSVVVSKHHRTSMTSVPGVADQQTSVSNIILH